MADTSQTLAKSMRPRVVHVYELGALWRIGALLATGIWTPLRVTSPAQPAITLDASRLGNVRCWEAVG